MSLKFFPIEEQFDIYIQVKIREFWKLMSMVTIFVKVACQFSPRYFLWNPRFTSYLSVFLAKWTVIYRDHFLFFLFCRTLIIENFIPPDEKVKLTNRASYDEENEEWKLKPSSQNGRWWTLCSLVHNVLFLFSIKVRCRVILGKVLFWLLCIFIERTLVSLHHFRCHRNYWYCMVKRNLIAFL